MKVTTRGIVLHQRPYSETSLIVPIYTEQSGLGSFIVSGVRTRNSRFTSALFQPLTLVELVYLQKPSGALQRITEIHAAPPFTGIPNHLLKGTMAMFLAEVLYRSIREEEPNGPLFHFLHHSIQVLDVTPEPVTNFHLYFMVQLSKHLGFFPNGMYRKQQSYFDLREGLFTPHKPPHPYVLEPEHATPLHELMHAGPADYHQVAVPGGVRNFLDALVLYFELHHTQGNSIRSHKVLGEALA